MCLPEGLEFNAVAAKAADTKKRIAANLYIILEMNVAILQGLVLY